MQSNIQTFIGCDAKFDDASIIIFGAPFDGTTSFRPGTRFAAEYIRMDSYGLETYSPYLEKDLEDYQIMDVGNLELPFGNAKRSLKMIEDKAIEIFKANKKSFLIGGEHLVSLGNITAAYQKYPKLKLIHFDAHADLRESYMEERLSHASVMRRAWDLLGDGNIYQFCIRSGAKEEFQWARNHTFLEKFTYNNLPEIVKGIGEDCPVYVTIDLDVFDPSVFPGTGTPEPGGISFKDMMSIINSLQGLNIIGGDIVELSPHYDASGISTAVACKVMRELLLTML